MNDLTKPATITELREKLPFADDDFLLRAIEKEMTLLEATEAMLADIVRRRDELARQTEAMQKEVAEKEAELDEMRGGTATAKRRWDSHVRAMTRQGMPRHKAINLISRRYPKLRAALVDDAVGSRRATASFQAFVAKYEKSGLSRYAAMRKTIKDHPTLHKRFIIESNRKRGSK